MDEMENGNRRTVRQESPRSTEVEDPQDVCASCCPLRTPLLAVDALEKVLHAMDMRMLRWTIGVTLKDKVSNDTVRSIFRVVPINGKMKEARLGWFGCVLQREKNSVAKTALKLDVTLVTPR
ncbi:hypothetical protein RB195_013359 [Necator americanus]|uniref:Uncharacterized protein n=1 Tax=Necator americanus TaxID=51031 RepID=A0ABR1DV29_NECAM